MSDDPAERNRAVYEQAGVVAFYRERDDLLPGEAAVFRAIANDRPMHRCALLDIGCGGGRTTAHLLPLVGRYVGFDYAAAMVEACRARFAGHKPAAELLHADARDLSRFSDGAFDIALFSFNGLDTLAHDDRSLALSEIRRVLALGGFFAYSTHLLPNVEPRFTAGGGVWHADARVRRRFAALNAGLGYLALRDWAMIRDAAHSFSLLTHYIRPEAIPGELADAGFGPPRLFASYAVRELDARADDLSGENWIYVLTRAV